MSAIRSGGDDAQSLVGQLLDERYRVDAIEIEHDFVTVALGTRLDDAQPVTLRRIPHDATPVEVAELRALVDGLNPSRHPRIARPLEVLDGADGFPWFVYTRRLGQTLSERLARGGRVGLDGAVAIGRDLLDALNRLHADGIVHGALAPTGVEVPRSGDARVLALLDLGIGRLGERRRSERGLVDPELCAVGFIAPEVAKGTHYPEPASDQFGVAALLYQTISGRPPFGVGSPRAVLARVVSADPAPLVGASPEVERVLRRGLSRLPAARFPSLELLIRALEGVAGRTQVKGTARMQLLKPREASTPSREAATRPMRLDTLARELTTDERRSKPEPPLTPLYTELERVFAPIEQEERAQEERRREARPTLPRSASRERAIVRAPSAERAAVRLPTSERPAVRAPSRERPVAPPTEPMRLDPTLDEKSEPTPLVDPVGDLGELVPRAGGGRWLALGGGGLAVLALLAILLTRGGAPPIAAPPPVGPAPPPALVRITLELSPANAHVLLDSRPVLPQDIELARSPQPVQLEVEAPGYASVTYPITPTDNQHVVIHLQPLLAPPPQAVPSAPPVAAPTQQRKLKNGLNDPFAPGAQQPPPPGTPPLGLIEPPTKVPPRRPTAVDTGDLRDPFHGH